MAVPAMNQVASKAMVNVATDPKNRTRKEGDQPGAPTPDYSQPGLDLATFKPMDPATAMMNASAMAADGESQDEQYRKNRGFTSNILTGPRGLGNMGQTSKVLLGQ